VAKIHFKIAVVVQILRNSNTKTGELKNFQSLPFVFSRANISSESDSHQEQDSSSESYAHERVRGKPECHGPKNGIDMGNGSKTNGEIIWPAKVYNMSKYPVSISRQLMQLRRYHNWESRVKMLSQDACIT